MCGITGFVDFNKKLSEHNLVNACDVLKHRGPNDSGTAVIDTGNALVGLGHRRLSVLDLSPLGHQPMYSLDKKVVIALNGEIYNFKEIRASLEQKGCSFASHSDTEVIIQAYLQFGISCLQQFIGMFALVIYDDHQKKLFLIRDRAGIKPLYYSFVNGCLLFASELKALHQFPNFEKIINEEALPLYFKYGYIKAPYSIFKNVHKLEPGCFAELNLNERSIQLSRYWNVLDYYNKPTVVIDEHEAMTQLDELCTSAFQYRMISDVPVGVFLSGGYDSSLVTAVLQKNSMNKLKTFTIGFETSRFNEAQHAREVAEYLGTDHNEYYCTVKEAQEIVPTLSYFYDEPFGDSSAIPTMLISRLARQQVTVALSADGGDEIFAGYDRYDRLHQIDKLKNKLPSFVKKSMGGVLQAIPGTSLKYKKIAQVLLSEDPLLTNDLLSQYFAKEEVSELISKRPVENIPLISMNGFGKNLPLINAVLATDFKTYMADDILTKVDRAAMSVGLEGREPLLDHRIIEWAAQLPTHLKYNNGNKKYLLKKLVHQYLPESIMNRPKMGFSIPLANWMKEGLKDMVLQTINKESLAKHNLLNEEYVLQLRNDVLSGKLNGEGQLWLIFMFQLWWNEWMA